MESKIVFKIGDRISCSSCYVKEFDDNVHKKYFPCITLRVGVKYFSKYLSKVQVLFHICKYKQKFKYSEYMEDIKYFFNQVQVKYKYFGDKQQHFPLPRWWIMLLIT